MKMFQIIRVGAALVALSVTASACSSTTAPTEADSTITPLEFTTLTFAGTLEAKGSGFYSFAVSQAGPVGLTLAAVQTPGGAALSTPLGIGIGVPSGTGCARTISQSTVPGLAAQMTVTLNPGTYCAAVFDTGTLTAAVNFAMRIRHP
ncbi:MAG TPA: hypothetical protein PKW63_13100 [Vicinamibacterales bacterium]|jgi:hypothetical protein|nr:hypothetical protein [Vicinamibacterales bacterium]